MKTKTSDIAILRDEIDSSLEQVFRQYLVGNLKNPQILNHFEDDIEIGISNYSTFKADIPHKHPVCSEYNYILEGTSKVLFLDDWTECIFHAGDFYSIPKNTPYASKHMAGTKVLFIKTPSINDKTKVDIDSKLEQWLSEW